MADFVGLRSIYFSRRSIVPNALFDRMHSEVVGMNLLMGACSQLMADRCRQAIVKVKESSLLFKD